MRVRFTETALVETEEIISYIAQDNLLAAGKVQSAINQCVVWIERWPHTPPVVHGDNVRAKLVPGYQYRIFYTLEDDQVIVRNVRSTKRSRPWEDAS